MNYSDLSFLLIPDIAMEADDITKQVNKIMGGNNAPAETKTEDQRDEDLTKTDNIFNDINKDDPNNDPVDTPQNDDNNDTQDPNTDDPANDQGDNPDDPNANQNDDNSDDQNMDQYPMADDPNADPNEEDPGMSPEDTSVFSDKNTLKENMIYFFNIMRYTISSLEAGLGTTENQETIRVVNSVIHNLYNCKDILYKIITEEMEKSPYETLVTKYVTLKRIYDISCDMLEEHFSNNPNNKVKYKRFKGKKR